MNHSRINAEALAYRFQSHVIETLDGMGYKRAENLTEEQAREILLFLQWRSWQPGGLEALAEQLGDAFPQMLGGREMLAGTAPRDRAWTLGEALPIWKAAQRRLDENATDFQQWADANIAQADTPESLCGNEHSRKGIAHGLRYYNVDSSSRARESAFSPCCPGSLAAWCLHHRIYVPDYFPRVIQALTAFMARHKEQAEQSLADTQVKALVFKRLRFAVSKRMPVMILGDARVGKTNSGAVFCQMHPWLARLVTLPESNTEWDFFASMADALGIPYSPSTSMRALKRSVEFVLEQTRLFIVFDEFHYALPVTLHRRAVPRRLNWIRSHIIDRGLGCAFFATRQTFQKTLNDFAEETRYQMEQWAGRVIEPLVLPSTLQAADLLQVAAKKFPNLAPGLRTLIVSRCIQREETRQSQHGTAAALSLVEHIARYAEFEATEQGAVAVTEAHVRTAMRELLGEDVSNPAPAPAEPSVNRRERPARSARATRETAAPLQFTRLPELSGDKHDAEDLPAVAG
jgi:hypothetical protein